RALRAGLGLVDRQRAALELGAVEGRDGRGLRRLVSGRTTAAGGQARAARRAGEAESNPGWACPARLPPRPVHPGPLPQGNAGASHEAAFVDDAGRVLVRPHVLKDLTSFARLWDRNLKDQGFVEGARAAARAAG